MNLRGVSKWGCLSVLLLLLLAGCTQPGTGGAKAATTTAATTTQTTSATQTTTTSPTTTTTTAPSLQGTLRVHYVSVGQGDGTIWELPGGAIIVYDCGDAASSAATNPVVQYLKNTLAKPTGTRLEALIASHGHLDHIGGCEEVFQEYQFSHVYDAWYQGSERPQSYKNFQDQAKTEGATLHFLIDDPTLTTDQRFHQFDTIPIPNAPANLQLQILWPASTIISNWDKIADSSIVLRMTYGSVGFCFQGDIETGQESTLAGYSRDMDCEVYLMGHHGSRYASSSSWLSKMDPEFAPVSFGANSYGHPTSEALCRVQQSGAQVFATQRLGTITISTDGSSVTVSPNQPETKDYCSAGANYWTSTTTTPTPTATTTSPTTTTPASSAGVEITAANCCPPGNYLPDEWVQITNSGTSSVTMTGWTLYDIANHVYSFPSGFTLGAGASVKVRTGSGTDTATDLYWNRGSAVWNNNGDTAYLANASGTVVDTYSW